MAVEAKEDRDKLEEYFKQKLNPLLISGAYKAVDWDRHKQAAAHKRKKKQKKNSAKLAEQWLADERSNAQREERARRFARDDDVRRTKFSDMRQRVDWSIDRGGDEGTSDNIVGTCTDIEKSYFRLTSAPDPSAIRPLEILEKALKLVQQNYTNNRDYTYANDQLRSIRQDLMAS
ncbi:unnamed protein product [Gongylonema pulchrum]|uniref:Pre-mRNA-splicing factor SYF2 n=1 Tax=Gongylonema pulchrum TaxID=637853 RepID=A0A183ECP0_9BILA|nr:unnamed protein product [Gongylonema pulchrum]